MATASEASDTTAVLKALRIEAACHFLIALVLVGTLASLTGETLAPRPGDYLVQALLVFAVMAGVFFAFLPAHLPLRRFGPANRVTLLRAVLVALLAGLVGQQAMHPGPGGWLVFALALAAAGLDGLDGWVARRRRCDSAFGARFDMELDAIAVVVLALMVFEQGKAGPWILAAGALRYLFLLAQRLWTALDRPLRPSERRRAVCAVQTLALVACLAPIVAPPLSALIAGLSLAALCGSFAVDFVWLLGRAAHENRGAST